MARKSSGTSKSAFVRGVLDKNAASTLADVQAAWKSAGNKDELHPSLYYQAKSKMGIVSKRGRKRKKRKGSEDGAVGAEKASPNGALLKIESTLDGLIQSASELRDNALTEALRTARRRVSSKLL